MSGRPAFRDGAVMRGAYYNEIDPFAAEWLRQLIKAGHIAPGDVDERSIEDVTPTELMGYRQCHFFAGIGVWSYALRSAGWPDDRPVWTGSCPCQPFSAAGKGKGFADERHLWPAFFHIIEQCGPVTVFGEQVAGKDGLGWLDLVSTDLEAVGYSCGAVPFPAAGIGAPHIRERLYWVADRDDAGLEGWGGMSERADQCFAGAHGVAGELGNAPMWGQSRGLRKRGSTERAEVEIGGRGATSGLADHHENGCDAHSIDRLHNQQHHAQSRGIDDRPGPTNGFWRDADWLGCRDGKWRPVEPGTFPLAHGAAARVGRLRGYGNAIVAPQAQAFIEAYMEVTA